MLILFNAELIFMPKYKITIEVIDILGSGKCSMNQKVGDKYHYPEDRGKLCPSSLPMLYPWILVMQSGGSFSFFGNDGNSVELGCPDHLNQVVYRIIREETDEQ
ncbi:MAG: TIGR04076 family protein [Candidatus Thorarchaeota archaeon]|nr:TIGR04076 family protein [Candidatus Thorarchaeota archaeon]